MLNFFKSKPILSNEDAEFQLVVYKWLLKNFGGIHFYKETRLILPTQDFFPSKVENADQAAIETFKKVKMYAGLEDWPCKLEAQEEDPDSVVSPTIVIANTPSSPLGTFAATKGDEITITYNPNVLNDPAQLVATFAHELSHYLTATSDEAPPGGWDNWEFVTDITATFLGFGIFMANSAFNFNQFTSNDTQGWQSSQSGYLSEQEHIYALAIFLSLKELPIEDAITFLKPNLRKTLKLALKEIRMNKICDELRKVGHVTKQLTQ